MHRISTGQSAVVGTQYDENNIQCRVMSPTVSHPVLISHLLPTLQAEYEFNPITSTPTDPFKNIASVGHGVPLDHILLAHSLSPRRLATRQSTRACAIGPDHSCFVPKFPTHDHGRHFL